MPFADLHGLDPETHRTISINRDHVTHVQQLQDHNEAPTRVHLANGEHIDVKEPWDTVVRRLEGDDA